MKGMMTVKTLPISLMELLECARRARQQAYAPYSNFSCGAAVLAGDVTYSGSNVENASYGLTCCAERVAVFKAVVAGARSIAAVAVVCQGSEPPLPCGACLQVIAEFAEEDPPIVLACDQGEPVAYRLDQLLPHPFQLQEGDKS